MRALIVFVIVAAIGVGGYFILLKQGIIWKGDLDKNLYDVRGIAVDDTNEKIDWSKVKASGEVQFAFIRATKGTSIRDRYYMYNNAATTKVNIKVSPYLEYQTGVDAQSQYNFFKQNVKPVSLGTNMPQAIKLFLDEDIANMSDNDLKEEAKKIYSICSSMANDYEKYPILYTTEDTYKNIIKNESEFDNNDLCVENTKRKALLTYSDDWYFWQYKDDFTVDGCKIPVKRLVYRNNADDFKKYWYVKKK